ncbi:AraC family transcriptional regulator [Asanoa sp. WMMD1127]|uniref:helix-turn-helix domain-containing protein n=1 Tax=Asanoa sp. WMMD1127 TaxID=3016107 RepID=UPI002417D05C|nr:AraC family transcriptional regulator [Asanoa sp. WMMD1127]MDG4820359.1 AraC family transcriptional regulator [Asanoa sp. WMMD1127]
MPVRPELAPFVSSIGYYESDLPAGRERTVPTGHAQLVVNLSSDELSWYAGGRRHVRGGVGFCPPQAGPLEISTAEQRRCVCVVFRPGGAYPFVGPVDALDEPVVDLGWSGLRDRLCEASPQAALGLLQSELVRRAELSSVDRRVAAAAVGLGRGLDVGAVSDRLGVTTGSLRRRFLARVGLTPKRYAGVARLQRLLGAVGGPDRDWARAAHEVGYFDQAHMVNDFRALTGLTPTAYSPLARERNHVSLPGPPAPRSGPR